MDFLEGWPFLVAKVARIPEPSLAQCRNRGALPQFAAATLEALQLLPQVPGRIAGCSAVDHDAGAVGGLAAAYMDVKPEDKQEILRNHRCHGADG